MRTLSTFILVLILVAGRPAQANSGKAFMMSVIYGTLAGTLVGAATLAFTSSPSGNLNNVARGASFGLYAGILMGLYVNSMDDEAPAARGEQGPGNFDSPAPVSPSPDSSGGSSDNNQTLNKINLVPADGLRLAFNPYLVAPPALNDSRWGVGVNFVEAHF